MSGRQGSSASDDLRQLLKRRATGLLMIGVLVGLIALTGALYNRTFADTVEVTVTAARGGLIMDPGNKVKYRGVELGRVTEVERSDRGAVLTLAIDADRAGGIPANVAAEIRASTLFGAKYVELVDAETPSESALAAGDVIDATGTTREINTLFESLDHVLSTVDVAGLNSTLHTLSTALEGRGDEIARIAAELDGYLTDLEPLLPTLRRDLRALASLSDLGVQVEPALIRILDNAAVTSRTLVDEEADLDRLLVDLAILGVTGSSVLGSHTQSLVANLQQLRPTTRLLREYSSALPCFLHGLERAGELAGAGAGGTTPGLNIIATLRGQIRPYQPGVDRPQVLPGTGPVCGPLPYLGSGDLPAPDSGRKGR